MAQKRATTKSAAKSSTNRGGTARKNGTNRSGAAARRAATPRKPWLSPQQQREMFAFGLIGLGLLLLVLLNTANRGVFGGWLVLFTEAAFGNSVIVLPLLFIVVGGLIFWQERFVDAPITGGNIAGVGLLTLVLLSATEFGATRIIFQDTLDAPTSIGGTIDLVLMRLFGVPGAAVILLLLFVIGVMLTFNVTLRQIFGQLNRIVAGLWAAIVGERVEEVRPDDGLEPEPVPYADELKKRPARAQVPNRARAELPKPDAPPPSDADLQREMIFTPIAARPTQANLFQRPDQAPATGETVRIDPPARRAELANADTQRIDMAATAKADPPSAKPADASPPAAAPDVEDAEIAAIDTSAPRQAWPIPSLTLLEDYTDAETDDNEKRFKARVIEDTLASFKIEAQVRDMKVGPAVTQYLLQPAIGVKVSRITGLEKDLALALAAPAVRIEAPVPGTPYIGIEIPNSAITSVAMKEVIDTPEFNLHKGKLKLALGKDVSGSPVIMDLSRAPHLLMAGATGSGKSAAINSIVCTLLLKHSPDDLKFIMIDPKMVELIVYNHIPHLLAPVVTELERVVSLLKWSVKEMERRYKLLAQKGYRNIDSFNQAARKGNAGFEPLPYIVIVIDELADLMMMAPDEVETLICRLAQMARAIGIHLILATQRPSVDVVTGLIKANFPTRMAFAVTSQIDSRVILDQIGAEHLLGRGDMLFLASDAPKPIRVQGTWVSEREVENVVRHWRAAGAQQPTPPVRKPLPLKPAQTEQHTQQHGDNGPIVEVEAVGVSPLPSAHQGLSDGEQDALLPKAIQVVRQHERASASLLQRRLRIGYSKAAQLIDLLEQQGIVGPADEGRSREVIQDNERL
jgi:DNA segregation ATPase FtsK/SpoIIIE, S-DNA-T family